MTVVVTNEGFSQTDDAELAAAIEDAKAAVQQALERARLGHGEVSLTLADDAMLHELNREYRNVDRPTDVLSFPLYEPDELDAAREEDEPLLGDIVISVPRAQEQAKEYGHSLRRELAYLAVHGCLHILGYDHPNEEEERRMHQEAEAVLGALGIVR